MPSTSMTSSSARVLSLLSLLSLWTAALACDPQVNIVVNRGDSLDAEFPIATMGFVFRLNGTLEDPLLEGPFDTNAPPSSDFVEVPPDVEFSLDVVGCTDAASCTSEALLIARGCQGGFVRGRDETLDIEIVVEKTEIANPLCPIEDPASEDVGFVAEEGGEGEGEPAG